MWDELDKLYEKNGTIVFIVGAGCSVDCGAPTMQQFMRKAREYRRQDNCQFKDEYDAMFDYREECLRVSYVFNRWWDNIEDLFTQAHLRLLAGIDGAQDLCHSMARAIWDVYRRPRPTDNSVLGYDMFANYLHAILKRTWKERRPYPVLVTTNYDLHMETALLRKHQETYHIARPSGHSFVIQHPFEIPSGISTTDYEDGISLLDGDEIAKFEPHVPNIEVIKLHGSVHWFSDKNNGSYQDGRITDIQKAQGGWSVPVLDCQTLKYEIDGVPLIVPPLLGKTTMHDALKAQWRRTIHALRHAHLIVIMGYSFPETDTFMSRLMVEGISKSQNLENIVICNKSTKPEFAKRIEDLFAAGWLKNCVDFIQAPFDATMREIAMDRGHFKDYLRNACQGVQLLRSFAGLN